jgi:Protein of unknown function (DUF2511)
MGIRVVSAITAAALALAGCADESRPPVHAEVSKAEWQNGTNNAMWPFTVDQGMLACYAPDGVTFTANGTEYALSDDARWVGHYPSVSPILIKGYVEINGERQPVPTSFESVTDRGRELCP